MRNVTTWGPAIAIAPIRDEKLEKKTSKEINELLRFPLLLNCQKTTANENAN